MTVGELLQALAQTLPQHEQPMLPADTTRLDVACTGVTHDSRRVAPGAIFVALRGLKVDAATFAPPAIAAGAAAIVAEAPPAAVTRVPWIVVSNARLALAHLAAAFYQHPSHGLQVVGVTGTNGKTTTTYLISAILEAAGVPCGVMGTVAYRIGTRALEATRTTPEAPEVQALMRQMVDAGCRACVMEVSSHALALHRVDGIRFAAGVFTNLTRDHLDFHGGMEDYFAAKRRLFEMLPRDAPAVINADDPRAPALVEVSGRPVTYGLSRPADVSTGPLSYSLDGLRFEVRTPQGSVRVRSRLVGRPNVYNILAATATTASLGVPIAAIERGLEDLSGVPGRFEIVSSPEDDITVVVDYAHTDDNPRGEDPGRIVEDVMRGAASEMRQSNADVQTVIDRREAVEQAVGGASAGDVVLIAGKGHEKYQEIAGRTLPFDDVAIAREALEARRVRSRVG